MDSTAFIRNTSRDPDNIIKNAMRSILLAMFLNQLLLNTATLVDAIIIGRFYSDASLGACGIISNLVFFNVTLGSIFAVGSQLECASALSNGELLRAREVFSASIYLILILTMILTAFSLYWYGRSSASRYWYSLSQFISKVLARLSRSRVPLLA